MHSKASNEIFAVDHHAGVGEARSNDLRLCRTQHEYLHYILLMISFRSESSNRSLTNKRDLLQNKRLASIRHFLLNRLLQFCHSVLIYIQILLRYLSLSQAT